MFLVLSINTRNNTAKVVGHAHTLEDAISEVTRCAREYVLTKSGPLLHRAPEVDARITFFSCNSPTNVHHVNVYRQRTDHIKGWTGSTFDKSRPAELIRRFQYSHYNGPIGEICDNEPDVPVSTNVTIIAKPRCVPEGGFPADIINDLMDSEQFKRHRQTSDRPVRRTVFASSSEDDE